MNNGVSGSWRDVLRCALGIVLLLWITVGDLVLCLFAALRHSAVHDYSAASRFGPAAAFWFVTILGRDKRDFLGVPLFFLGIVVCGLATAPLVSSCSFSSGTHEIAFRSTAAMIPLILAKAVVWAYMIWGKPRVLRRRNAAVPRLDQHCSSQSE